MDDEQRREFQDANGFEDLPGKWQAAVAEAGRSVPSCGPSEATRERLGRDLHGKARSTTSAGRPLRPFLSIRRRVRLTAGWVPDGAYYLLEVT
jgi:hypothetical protein